MISIVGGFVAIALGILALINWSWRVIELIQGLLPIVLISGGIVALVAGMSIFKEQQQKITAKADDEEIKDIED